MGDGRRLVACLLLLLSACTPADDAWGRVRESGVLRVGMDASFPPFEAVAADGTLNGFDVDLARELGRRLGPSLGLEEGLEVQFVANLPYDGLYDALAVGRVDVVISALVVNRARMADFAYSATYFDAGTMLVVREGHQASVSGMIDMAGHTLSVEFGTPGDLEARRWARRLPDLTLLPCQTAFEALEAVAAGEADGALVDHVSALSAAGEGSGLVILAGTVVEEPYAVAVHHDSAQLLDAVNGALADMEADGTLDALAAEWLGGGE